MPNFLFFLLPFNLDGSKCVINNVEGRSSIKVILIMSDIVRARDFKKIFFSTYSENNER